MNKSSRLKELHALIFGEKLFVLVLMLLAIGLPVAPFLVGFSQFFLLFNWVVEGDFKLKLQRFKNNRALHYFLLLFFVHVIWLINTENFEYAFHDLKIKLPLLALPIIIATSHSLTREQLKQVLLIFSATVVVGSFISLWVFMGWTETVITDIREISIFVSHIRFGLMIVLAVCVFSYYLRADYNILTLKVKIFYAIAIIWLLTFLLILQSVTSWVVLFVLAFFIIIFYYKKLKYKAVRVGAWVTIIGAPLFILGLIAVVIVNSYITDEINEEALPKQTKLGNKYRHYPESRDTENGNYVWLNYCHKELAEYWSKYSDFDFEGKDAKGQALKFTLVRYLTSRNLPKDAEGLSQLTNKDIDLIESGHASVVYGYKFTPYIKLYELAWELKQYFLFGDPNAKTVSMRIEFFLAGSKIFRNNLWFGIGNGDVQDEFNKYYEETSSRLLPKYRLRAHNQYLTFLVSFGLIGFIIVIIAFVKPILKNRENYSALTFVFVVVMLISMLNEDTLETQSGATIFAFFYALFVLRRNSQETHKKGNQFLADD